MLFRSRARSSSRRIAVLTSGWRRLRIRCVRRAPSIGSPVMPTISSSTVSRIDADSNPVCPRRPGDDRAPIAVIQGVARSLTRIRSSFLGHPRRSIRTRSPVERRKTGHRLWKCRRYGNHRTVSTAPWKSRTTREIPTFPQPLPVVHDKTTKTNTTNSRRLHTRAGQPTLGWSTLKRGQAGRELRGERF